MPWALIQIFCIAVNLVAATVNYRAMRAHQRAREQLLSQTPLILPYALSVPPVPSYDPSLHTLEEE